MSHQPPSLRVVGSTLHASVVAGLAARGVDEPTRQEYLVEAARLHGHDYRDPMQRELLPGELTPWARTRIVDNTLGDAAMDLLARDGVQKPTREQYLDAFKRVEDTAGRRYREIPNPKEGT